MKTPARKAEGGYQLTVAVVATADALLRASQKLFRPYGLTAAQFNVLNLLADVADGMSQRDLSAKLVVDKSNVTGLVDRMEKAGWVTREADPADRRVSRVQLTSSGKKLWAKVNPAYLQTIAEVTGPISAGAVETGLATLEQLHRRASEWEP